MGNTRKVKWNTCIPLECEDDLEYKYVYSTFIPLYSTYSTGIHGFSALWNTKWNTYSPCRIPCNPNEPRKEMYYTYSLFACWLAAWNTTVNTTFTPTPHTARSHRDTVHTHQPGPPQSMVTCSTVTSLTPDPQPYMGKTVWGSTDTVKNSCF